MAHETLDSKMFASQGTSDMSNFSFCDIPTGSILGIGSGLGFFQMNIEVILYKRGVKKNRVQCLIICIAVCCCKHTRLLRNVFVKFSALLSNEMYTFPLGYNTYIYKR